MSPEHTKATHRIIERTTRYYHRRWAQSMSEDDIRQQAWLVALEAARNPKLDVNRFNAYITKAVSNSVGRYCWQQSSLVSQTYKPRLLPEIYQGSDFLPTSESFDDQLATAESLCLIEKARRALEQRMTELYNQTAEVRQAPNPRFNASVRVLLDNTEPQCAAAEEGATPAKVYATTKYLKRHVANDALAKQLLTIIAENRAFL